MDPDTKEGIVGGERRAARNNPFRSLAQYFCEAIQPPNTNKTLGAIQDTPGEGTSMVEGPALHFLHRLLRESPELEKEMVRLYHTMMKEHGILEEGFWIDKEGEKERARQKRKMPALPVENSSPA